MSLVQSFTKLPLKLKSLLPIGSPCAHYLKINGQITSQTTREVNQKLERLPKNSQKLAVVINSIGGELAQAVIIAQKLRNAAKDRNIQLLTFAEGKALNSAFYILSHGNQVYVDQTTFIGGIGVGISKVNLGLFSRYLDNVVYSEKESYFAEINKNQSISEQKAKQMKQHFNEFSQQMKSTILSNRNKITPETDLSKYYYGADALRLGLVDGVGRLHQVVGTKLNVEQLRQSQIQVLMKRVKKRIGVE